MGDLLKQLLVTRRGGPLVETVAEADKPADLDAAYAIQDALADGLDQPVAGWKVGATAEQAMAFLGLSEPFGGRVFGDRVWRSPATLSPKEGGLALEFEFAFRISRDLNLDERFDEHSIVEVIDAIIPAIEVNRPSYRDPFGTGALPIIADNGANDGMVLGEPVTDWQPDTLPAATVEVFINGEHKAQGKGEAVLGHPLRAVAWLANDRAQRSQPLRAGQVILSGSSAGTFVLGAGEDARADFGAWGELRVTVAE